MEILRHPLYSILAVLLIGVVCGLLAHGFRERNTRGGRALATRCMVGIAGAFIGFHAAMLSNQMTDVILMPFVVSFICAALAVWALRHAA